MASVLPSGEIRFADGRILYNDTPITGKDFIELTQLLPQLVPVIGRAGLVGFPFGGGGGGGGGQQGPPGPAGAQGPAGPTSSGTVSSGSVSSGAIASGAVQGFFGSTPNIASGTIGVFDLGSGAVIAGAVGSGAIVSGNVASGQISDSHFASGARVPYSKTVTNTYRTVETISGVRAVMPSSLQASSGNNSSLDNQTLLRICMASDLVSPAVNPAGALGIVVDNVLSGDLATVYERGPVRISGIFVGGLAPNPIFIGTSGELSQMNAVMSGLPAVFLGQTISVTSGNVNTWIDVNPSSFRSGHLRHVDLASGIVRYENIASGQVGPFTIGSGAVTSGTVASGQLSDDHFASGATIDGSRFSVESEFFTASEDIIAPAYAVSPVAYDLSLPIASGNFILGGVVQARSCSSGRFPAIGLIVGNVVSGTRVKVYHKGLVFASGFSPNVAYVNLGPDNIGRLNIAGGGAIVGGTPETVVYQTMARHMGSGYLWLGSDFRQVGEAFVGFGMIASGSIDNVRLGSGAVRSGHIASGAIATFSRDVLEDGVVAGELISGVCCVRVTSSGLLQVAMAAVSGRMPADGIAIATPASMNSGTVASFIRMGRVLLGFLEPAISGKQGSRIWVGASGQVVTISGAGGGVGIGPTNSGAQGQMIGRICGSGEILIDVDNTLYSGEAVITTDSRFWPL